MKQRYQTPLPSTWFMQRPGFRRFMAREATAIFLAVYLLLLLGWRFRVGQGAEAYASLVQLFRSPVMVVVHVVLLISAVYHSITWFNLTPKIMPLYVAEEKVPDALAAIAMGYLPWIVVTGGVLWGVLAIGGGS
ncbi:MAG: succinate dehydrogenase/fumarate reductase transmembrane subunit [Planctomycetota bacterium]|jgi:fumarate reductase subunit C